MKNIFLKLMAIIAIGSLFSCEPVEDRNSLPDMTLKSSDLNFTAVVTGNNLAVKNMTPAVIPYWNYTDSQGYDVGHSNLNETTTFMPFAGTYNITFSAFVQGGSVSSSKKVTVLKNDSSYFSDPRWGMLTNREAGKTWVLNMVNPIGWAGLDYPGASGDNWNWYPDYAGNTWVMENKDWGQMTLDLNERYNVSVTQTALKGTAQTTKKGTFVFDMQNNKLILNGGVEILYGGDYHPDVSNWSTAHVIKLTDTELELGVIRDQSRTGEGKCQIVFRYKPKP